jgi:hypothetical protein
MLTLLPKRFPNKIINIFLLEGFFHLPPVSTTPVANLELRISSRSGMPARAVTQTASVTPTNKQQQEQQQQERHHGSDAMQQKQERLSKQ